MEYYNEAKLMEQNGSRLRDSKKGPLVTKEEGWSGVLREGEWDWGVLCLVHMVWEGSRGEQWSMWGGLRGEQCSTEKAHSEPVTSCCTDGQ